jgi:hypothetical protein
MASTFIFAGNAHYSSKSRIKFLGTTAGAAAGHAAIAGAAAGHDGSAGGAAW